MFDFDVAVIGGGPAGLTAAYQAAKQGLRPVLLERDEQVGGIARTVSHNDYRFDIGGHRFFTKVHRIEDLWDEILPDDLLLRPRLSRIYYNQRFFSYPLKPLDAFIKLGPLESLACVGSLLRARMHPLPDEATLDAWVINRFGRRLFETFFRSYTEKVWGVPCSEISATWAAQRIKSLSLTGAILNAFFRSGSHTSLIERFKYPRLGPGEMWERCRDRIVDMGGLVMTGCEATRLRRAADRVECVAACDSQGEERCFRARHFVSSMALKDLIGILLPAPPGPVSRAAERLRYRDFIVVTLIIDRSFLFPDNWIYIHSPKVKVGRIQNFKNWSEALVPDPQTTSVGLEYFTFKDDEMWHRSDRDLIAMASREMREIGLLHDDDEVIDGCVVRMEKTYPMYVGETFEADLALVKEFLGTLKNLQCCGRNGQHRYNNQDHSMYTACLAVENMLGADHDIWRVNVDEIYHEQIQTGGDERGGTETITGAGRAHAA